MEENSENLSAARGNDKTPIIIDNGTGNFKVGFAGEDSPKIIVPSILAWDPFLVWLHVKCPNISRDLVSPLQWLATERDGVSKHEPRDCLLNRLFRRRSKKTSKLRDTGLYEGNSPVTGEFPAQRASNAENVSIWWRHHAVWYVSSAKTYSKSSMAKTNSGTNLDMGSPMIEIATM